MMRARFTVLVLATVCALAAWIFVTAAPLHGGAERGKEFFEKRCTGCHALDDERVGPRMRGVFGRAAGTIPTFPYSDAVRNSKVVWDAASLNKWLTDPDAFIPDNDMAFRVADAGERAEIIAFLKGLSGNPSPAGGSN